VPEHEHGLSVAVWDLTSPIVVGRQATLKVGIACPSGCDLSGSSVDVYNDAGARVASGNLGSALWPGTTALHWVELDVAAPDADGDQVWRVHATTPHSAHGDTTSVLRFVVCRPPEHRVTLHVIDKNSGAPLGGVELRVGRFRATTNDTGIAHVEVPGGTYEVGTWKYGYEVLSQTAAIASDTTVHLELTAEPEVERPYWM
jgi:hypothetical protein